jgi:hypothetical protein
MKRIEIELCNSKTGQLHFLQTRRLRIIIKEGKSEK